MSMEGFAGGVLDHRDSVPDGFAHQLLFHVAEQDGLRADLGEDLEGRVEVVGFLAADSRLRGRRRSRRRPGISSG